MKIYELFFRRDRTELGASLYNYQHEIQRQTETMERYEKEMDTMNKKRDKIEKKAKELKVVLGEMKAEVRKEEEKGEWVDCDFRLKNN